MSLRQRFPTAMIMLVLLLVVTQWAPAPIFMLVLQVVILAALLEFCGLAKKAGLEPRPAVGLVLAALFAAAFYFPAFPLDMALFAGIVFAALYYVIAVRTSALLPSFPASIAVTLLGPVYIAFTLDHLYLVRVERGSFGVFFLCGVVFLGDSGSYLFGSLFGRHKMTPVASPNKTWEGSAGGILFAAIGAFAGRMVLFPDVRLAQALAAGVLLHAVAQISDPLESLFKRAAGVKDSSGFLPGHGGFLDRIDSLLLATPFFYYFVRAVWK
jgi:phosphatidate cytidylyltransferase